MVSGGELQRALAAGVTPDKIVFSGVGKTREELAEALKAGVTRINVESDPELDTLSGVAAGLGITADIAVRINPDVDAKTHEKITTGKSENKFGIDLAVAQAVYARAAQLPGINVCGVALHIGSQLLDLAPYRQAYGRAVDFVRVLRAGRIDDLGPRPPIIVRALVEDGAAVALGVDGRPRAGHFVFGSFLCETLAAATRRR